MDYSKIDLKVREARFFLSEMTKLASSASAGALDLIEPVGFNLSAFLSASRSIDYRLRSERPTTYLTWYATWTSNLSAIDADLVKAMVDDRNFEVHASGSNADRRDTQRDLGAGEYSLGIGGSVQIVGPPGVNPLATVFGEEYCIKIGATEKPAVKACEAYLALLERMVEAFKTAYP